MFFSRVNIWTKLLVAFSFISSLTLIVGVIALLLFGHSGSLMEQISEEHLPEIVEVAEFARIGGEIVVVAPNILSAADDDVRDSVKKDLDDLLVQISEKLEALSIEHLDARNRAEVVVDNLKNNLSALQASVKLQVEEQKLIDRKTERLRWLFADLMGELDPLSQDYAYNVDAEIERIVDSAREGVETISASNLQVSMRVKEAIENVRSKSVLLVNLMMQASTFNSSDRLDNLSTLAEDTIALIKQDMKEIQNDISSLTLKQVLADIYRLAVGEESVFVVRTRIINHEMQGREILKQNRAYVAELDTIIDYIVIKAENTVAAAADGTQATLKRARTALVLIILVSFATVTAVMWYYVRGNIVARLAALSRSMLAIAKGDLNHQVSGGGNDEIGRMAEALEVFREEAKERRRMQNELVQAGKLAALGQLSAGIAHELNQPLSAIRYYLHNASKLMELGETATHKENLAKMDELVDRMASMINHLKTFARRQQKQLGQIDIMAALNKAFELIGGKLERNSIRVTREYPVSPLSAYGDSTGLEQVLVNIIGNAVDAVLNNTEDDRQIVITVFDCQKQVRIDISDNGSGFETRDPEIVFDPFYTTKEVGQGLGLGLSISYNIIRSFGGTISVSNAKTGGACFSILLEKTITEEKHETDW